jgi:hypothetical protein
MGAGGSTRASTGLAGFALKAGRNLDMTNAGGLIGTLSKGLGSADVTKEAFVKLLAEGTRVGLDGSEYREENRKFTEAAAQAVSQSGTSSAAGVEQIMSRFGSFFGADKTSAGIEAGKSAYDRYQQMSGETTGARGSMSAAGILTNKHTRAMSPQTRQAISIMHEDMFSVDDRRIIEAAKEATLAGVPTTPQDLVDAKKEITKQSQNINEYQDIARDKYQTLKEKYGIQGPLPEDYSGPGAEELISAQGQAELRQSTNEDLANDPRKLRSTIEAQSPGLPENEFIRRSREEGKKAKIAADESTGRAGDETEKTQAAASQMANQLFKDMRKEIVHTATDVAHFASELAKLRIQLTSKDPNERARAADYLVGNIGTGSTKATDAPTAGPKKQ